jgi:hypothetical protein
MISISHESKQYVAGASAKHNGNSANADSALAESFVTNTATKTSKSKRVIQEEIQMKIGKILPPAFKPSSKTCPLPTTKLIC